LSSEAFVPIRAEIFQKAFATALHSMDGSLVIPPEKIVEPIGGSAQARAWFLAGLLFADPAERASFRWRVGHVLSLLEDRKYSKYRDVEGMSRHVALLRAVCSVNGSVRTTKRSLRTAFNAEFKRHLAHVASGGGRVTSRH
jgi:hypothetical protein